MDLALKSNCKNVGIVISPEEKYFINMQLAEQSGLISERPSGMDYNCYVVNGIKVHLFVSEDKLFDMDQLLKQES